MRLRSGAIFGFTGGNGVGTASPAAAFPRNARRGGGRQRILHRSRHAHVLQRRQRRGCRHRGHAGRVGGGVLALRPRRRGAHPDPHQGGQSLRHRRRGHHAQTGDRRFLPQAQTHADEIDDPPEAQRAEGLGAGGRHPLPRWSPAWWTPPSWPCAISAPSLSPKPCSRPSNWPTVSRSTRCAPVPSPVSAEYLLRWPASGASSCPTAASRGPARSSASRTWPAPCAPWPTVEKKALRRRRQPRQGHGRGARLLLSRRYRPPHRRFFQAERRPAALRRHGGVPRRSRKSPSPPPSTATPSTSRASGARARHDRGAEHPRRLRSAGHGPQFRRNTSTPWWRP